MPIITVPDDTYERLAVRASELGISVEALAVPVLEQASRDLVANGVPAIQSNDLAYNEWKERFDALLVQARNRADSYPPGFQADVSRDSIYEGCGE